MSNKDILALCFGNLRRRKARTVLSVIGVVVGVCAIVVMVSIGIGLDVSFQSQIEGFGNLHMVEVYCYGQAQGPDGQKISLDESTINRMAKIDGVTAITPIEERYMVIGIDKMITQASVYGVNTDFIQYMDLDVAEGRLPHSGDSNYLIFGQMVACQFYNPKTSYGSSWSNTEPTVNVISNKVILTGDWNYGTKDQGSGDIKYEEFKAEGIALLNGDSDENAYRVLMDMESFQKVLASINKSEGSITPGRKTYSEVMIYAQDADKIADICTTIREEYGMSTYSLTDILSELKKTTQLIELVLGGIGAVSLLVAAIGIANTMIMSVYERTREIGVMKVIGASFKDIRKMFLLEAGLIGLIGGVIGIAISYGLSLLMNTLLAPVMEGFIGTSGGTVSVIPIWLAAGAMLFAFLVGVLSGYYPAKRAMNLSALEGLKNE